MAEEIIGIPLNNRNKPNNLQESTVIPIQEKEAMNVSKLFVLVHPVDTPTKSPETERMITEIERRFTVGETDVLWFMPLSDIQTLSGFRKELKRVSEHTQQDHDLNNWPELYKKLRDKFPGRVLLMTDIVAGVKDQSGNDRVQEILDRTKEKGLKITKDTELILGGTYLDLCVKNVGINLLESLEVNELKLDTKASTYYMVEKGLAITKILRDIESNRALKMHASFDPKTEFVTIAKT